MMPARRRLAIPALAAVLPVFAVFSSKGVVVLIALCAVAVLSAGRPFLPSLSPRVLILPGLILAWSAITLLWSIDPWISTKILNTAMVTAIGIVLYSEVAAADVAQRALILRFAVWGCAAAAAILILSYIDQGRLLQAVTGRGDWLNKVKPASTILVIILWPAAVYVWNRHSAWAAALFVATMSLPLYLMDAKTAKVASLAAIMVFAAALAGRRLVARAMAVSMFVIVLLAPILAAQPLKYPDLLNGIPSTGMHRLVIWDFVATRIAERPLLGWGFNTSRVMPGGQQHWQGNEILPLHPHNAPLQVWLETGLPGAVLVAVALAALALAASRGHPREAAGALASYAAACIVGMLSYGIWQDWWLCSLLFILLMCRALPQAPQPPIP